MSSSYSGPTDKINLFKPDLIPVEGKEGWYRDPETNAIVNCNDTEYDNYMAAFNRRQNKDQKLESLQDDVSALKSDLGEIKDLLKSLTKGE
jgi:hypothetical protein